MKKRIFSGLLLLLLVFPFLRGYLGVDVLAAEDTGVANPSYTLTCVDGTRVSTKTEEGKVTLLIFGTTSCSITKNTLTNISKSSWVGSSNLRVIFEDCAGNTLEDVKAYGDNFGCKEISFCYGSQSIMMNVMYSYTKLFGVSDKSWPVTVLIDGNNRVRNVMTGTKTADELKAEIQKFAMLENEMPGTGVGDGTGDANPGYTFTSIDGSSISTTANTGQVSVILFGTTVCGYTKGTVREIAQSPWIDSTDARIIFAEVHGATQTETGSFASDYGHGKMIFCYDDIDPYGNIYKAMWAYLRIGGLNGGTYPFTVFIDGNNKVREVLTGPQTAEDIKAKIDEYAKASADGTPGSGSGTPGTEGGSGAPGTGDDSGTPGTGDGAGTPGTGGSNGGSGTPGTDGSNGGSGTPGTDTGSNSDEAVILNVSGLKAASQTTNSVKLTWKEVSGAEKYYIYQYNSSAKKWKKIASVPSSELTYTVKKLKAGTGYRFGVKACRTQSGKQVLSDSYVSLYTATKPAAVKFSVKAGKKKATLKWSKVSGATGYYIYCRTSTKAAWKKLKTVKKTSYSATKLKSGQSCSFMVKAYKTYKGKTYVGSSQTKKVKIK
ncbi:MAG TPA: hypothetical protein DF613_12225 [Lachnospiraceae bacterium]|nr:hypothetical protein [Lachnospiraceae bacterium]